MKEKVKCGTSKQHADTGTVQPNPVRWCCCLDTTCNVLHRQAPLGALPSPTGCMNFNVTLRKGRGIPVPSQILYRLVYKCIRRTD